MVNTFSGSISSIKISGVGKMLVGSGKIIGKSW